MYVVVKGGRGDKERREGGEKVLFFSSARLRGGPSVGEGSKSYIQGFAATIRGGSSKQDLFRRQGFPGLAMFRPLPVFF